MASGRRFAGAIRCLVNAKSLKLVPILMYGNNTMVWKEKERSRIWAVRMDNLRDLLSIKRMDKLLNAWIRQVVWSDAGCGRKD